MPLPPLLLVALLAGHDAMPAQEAESQRQSPGRVTQQTVAVPKGTRLSLSNDAGEIVVKTWDRDSVQIRASHSSRMQVTAELQNQVLTIGARSDRVNTAVDYELTVPVWISVRIETRFSDIEIDGVSGGVSVESIRGELTLRNLGGSVVAKSIEGKISLEGGRGKVQMTTVEGDVSITKSTGDVTVDTTEGDITITGVQTTSLSVSTVDGDISFTGQFQPSGHYEFTSHDGDILLTIPESSSVMFGVRTYGDENQVHTTLPIKPSGPARKGRRATYTLGTGSSQVEVEAFDGSFYLRRPGETVKKED